MSEQTTPMASEEMLIASFEERTSKSHDSDVQLPIRQASPKLSHNGNVVELPQPLSNDNGESGLDGNSLSESWEDIRTPDADANVTNAIESGEMARQPWELRRVWWDYEEFYDAIEHGDIAAVKAMLDDGANIERKADDGGTPLVIAIYELQWDIIRLLLERGANIHHPVIDTPPIFHAISGAENAPAIMQLLLDHGASLEVTSGPTSMNPLHWAAVKGMVHAADFIISKGFDMERRCLRGKTPLILAAERGHTTVVKLLRAKGAALHVRSNNGGTALMWATSEGHLETVKFLLEEGMNVEDRDKEGCTALSVACDHGHVDIVQVLIERGADVNTLSDEPMSRTPAMEAALSGHTEVLQALLDQGADLTMDPPGGVALLERAMKAGYLDTVKTILKHLGGPDYPTQSVALQMAMAGSHATMKSLMTTVSIMYPHIDSKSACSGDLAWIKWVLDGGGDLVRSRAMRHLLHVASSEGHVKMVAELLTLGADPNTVLVNGDTPINVAVAIRNQELVSVLLDAGADPAKCPRHPRPQLTPVHRAIAMLRNDSEKDTSIVDLLLTSGRCKFMLGKSSEFTAFAYLFRPFHRSSNGLTESLAFRMLESLPDVNADRCDDGSTMMHVAVQHRKTDLIDRLQQKGADINAKDNKGDSPFLLACRSNKGDTPFLLACRSEPNFLDFLISHSADPLAVNADCRGALHVAAACGQVEALKFLLQLEMADGGKLDIDAVDALGHTPLISAITTDHEDAALYLLERSANPTIRITEKGRIALHYAAGANMHRVVAEMLKDSDASINAQDNDGWTPLALACISPSPTVVSTLLAHGANPEICTNEGARALHIALARPLVASRDKRFGDPALLLLNHDRIDLSATDARLRTPLHLACEFCNAPAAMLLLAHGVSPHECNQHGQTPLASCSRPDITQALIEHGADVNHADSKGRTPLHEAVTQCWVSTFSVLRAAGADLEARDREGVSVREEMEMMGGMEQWVRREPEFVREDVKREQRRVQALEDRVK